MEIKLLNEETISRISAGEVIERPLNVVKELVENSIDAGSTAITVEIRDGGISMIRVTDNGCGIERNQIAKAFVRHATSKIRDAEDLSRLSSLGFRGEALASIAAVAQVEMITKVREAVAGTRAVNDHLAAYSPDAPVQISLEEIGAPDGTTVIVRNLFGSIPVRRKFLRQPQTEAGYITDLIEKQALSHPDVSIHYRVNGQEKLHTSGNGSLQELIYRIYGRETAAAILPIHAGQDEPGLRLDGYIGRPEISRSSRSFETFFINGRMLQSKELSAGLEEGYRTDLMQHRFPFAVLHLTMPPEDIDVNVHPSKMEVRFRDRAWLIAAGSGVGHDLELTIDGQMSMTYNLNNYFQYSFGDYRSGTVGYTLPELSEGEHTLTFRAWDVLNNSSVAELKFRVEKGQRPQCFSIACTRNPATTSTSFVLNHDRVGSTMNAILEVFDTSGRQLWRHVESGVPTDNTYTIDWDLTVDSGSRLHTGVYLYRVVIECEGSTVASPAKKLIILNH